MFTNAAYVSLDWGSTVAAALRSLASQVHGGIYTMEAGDGGPEFASGMFRARFHYFKPTALMISTVQEGTHFEFKASQGAPAAPMFLRTEPALLERFAVALERVNESGHEAVLECLQVYEAT